MTRRTCDELGVCQASAGGRRCAECTFPFAPGVIDAPPPTRRQIWLDNLAWLLEVAILAGAVCAGVAAIVGYLVGKGWL